MKHGAYTSESVGASPTACTMLKKDIPKIREQLKTGKYLVIPANMYKSYLKKAQAPQGLSDDELRQGHIVSAEEIELC